MKLIYDIASKPDGLDPANLVKMYEQHHVIFWDSLKNATKPRLYKEGRKGQDIEVLIVDTAGKEMNFEQYTEQYRDEEYWKRELHNCKNSPIYFYKNYGTAEYPATQEGIQLYMKGMGLQEIVAKDSDDAEKLWNIQKEKVANAMSTITVEFLKERGAVIQVLKSAYDTQVAIWEEQLKDHVRLVDSNNVPLPDKNRIGNLAEKISKCYPIHPAYSDAYRTKKGKWDRPMLFNTDYAILLKMYYDIRELENREQTVLGATT